MKRVAREITAWTVLAAAVAAGGCIVPHQSFVTDVNPVAWSDAAQVVVPNADTLTLRDIGLFLRCNDRFTEDTLTVRIAVITPDSLRHEELFTLSIPRSEAPAPLTREADIPYRRRALFARTGDYRIRITPSRTVRGVLSAGIDLTKSE